MNVDLIFIVECRTNDDCEEGTYCTWHDIHVSGSCDPGYYAPSNCPLGECKGNTRFIKNMIDFKNSFKLLP